MKKELSHRCEKICYEDYLLTDDLKHYQQFEDSIFFTDFILYLKTLPVKKRKILIYHIEGLSNSQIAQKLGYSRQYVNRTKKHLIECFIKDRNDRNNTDHF